MAPHNIGQLVHASLVLSIRQLSDARLLNQPNGPPRRPRAATIARCINDVSYIGWLVLNAAAISAVYTSPMCLWLDVGAVAMSAIVDRVSYGQTRMSRLAVLAATAGSVLVTLAIGVYMVNIAGDISLVVLFAAAFQYLCVFAPAAVEIARVWHPPTYVHIAGSPYQFAFLCYVLPFIVYLLTRLLRSFP